MFAISTVKLIRVIPLYLSGIAFSVSLQVLQILTVYLAAKALPDELAPRLRTAFDRFSPKAAALWVLAVTLLLSFFSYERHPHIPDEAAYLTHAPVFRRGHADGPRAAGPRGLPRGLLELPRRPLVLLRTAGLAGYARRGKLLRDSLAGQPGPRGALRASWRTVWSPAFMTVGPPG